MSKIFRILGSELFIELCIFTLLTFIYMAVFPRGSEFDFKIFSDLYSVGSLWLAIIAYRAIFLQLPIAWASCVYFYVKKELHSWKIRAGTNFITFIVIILVASMFSEVLSGFLEMELIHVTLIAIISTAASPLLYFYLFGRNKSKNEF